MSKKIIINIDNDNKINIETENYKGPSCIENIKKIFEEFLDIDNFENKADFYETENELDSEVNIKR